MYDKEVNGIYCTNCSPNIIHVYDAMNPAQKILEGLKKKKTKNLQGVFQYYGGKKLLAPHHTNAKAREVKREDALLP